MTTSPERGVEETHNTREELIKELRMVANMINMCERIQWGRETTLMDKAADMLETHLQELQKAREDSGKRNAVVKEYKDEDVMFVLKVEDGKTYEASMPIPKWAEVGKLTLRDQSELDQPTV